MFHSTSGVPYIRIQALKEFAPQQVDFFKDAYVVAGKGNYDIYVVFVERGLSLLNSNGLLGFILPHKFFNAQYGESLRDIVGQGKYLAKVIHFGDQQVFSGATTYTCLMFLNKAGMQQVEYTKVDDLNEWRQTGKATTGTIPALNVTCGEWNFSVGKGASFHEKLNSMPVKVGDIADRIAQGIRTSANEIYVVDVVSESGSIVTAYSKHLGRDIKLEKDLLSSFLQGREIKPYSINPSGKAVIIPYSVEDGQAVLIAESELKRNYGNAYSYLFENKSYLENREHGRMHGENWYGFIYPKNIEFMKSPKILVPDIADRASFALDYYGQYAFTSGYGITVNQKRKESWEYVLGLLNSKVLDKYLKAISTTMRGGFFRYFAQFIEQLPFRAIDFSDPADKAQHDQMVSLVEKTINFKERVGLAKTPQDKTTLERQIAATGAEIDQLVYQLYDLTDEEIAIVEGR